LQYILFNLQDYTTQLHNIQDIMSGTKGNRSNLQTPVSSLASQPNSPNPLRHKAGGDVNLLSSTSASSKMLNQLPLPLVVHYLQCQPVGICHEITFKGCRNKENKHRFGCLLGINLHQTQNLYSRKFLI